MSSQKTTTKKKLENMHLRERISYGYNKVIMMMLISGLFSIVVIGVLFANMVHYVENVAAADEAVKICRINVNASARNIREMALNDDTSSYDGYEQTVKKLLTEVDSELKILKKTGAISKENYEEYATALSDWGNIGYSIIDEIKNGDREKAVDAILNDCTYVSGKNAVVLTNTSKGHGYTANVTINAQPVEDLNMMLAYTHTESKEISGLPGSDPVSTWQGMLTIDGPNFATVQRSRYVVPDKVIAAVNYNLPFRHKGLLRKTSLNLFYSGYSASGYSFAYTNDMNGDGINNDMMYIPKDDSEIKFKNEADRTAFWNFVDQDSYLKNHKGEYAEAYAARAPWVHRFDLRITEDFSFKAGKTEHHFQLSLDFMNIGNMINSKWGVMKNASSSNGCRILKYEGMDDNKTPIFSMYKINGEYPTETYSYNRIYTECWKMQVGIRYIFN